MRRNLNYKDDLLADLRNDLGFAAEYLSSAYDDSPEAFLVALRDVVEARQGMTQLAAQANVNRENLYRSLSDEGNPRYSTFRSVLHALGMTLTVQPKQATTSQSPHAQGGTQTAIDAGGNITTNSTTTTSNEFRNVATTSNLILTNPQTTAARQQSTWTCAGVLLPGFIAHATGDAGQLRITALGD